MTGDFQMKTPTNGAGLAKQQHTGTIVMDSIRLNANVKYEYSGKY